MAIKNNLIQIKNLNNETLDFDNVLSPSKSILIKNCINLKINIQSKINKIIIENSKQIFLTVKKLVTGFEISHSKHILLHLDMFVGLSEDFLSYIPHIDLYKSELYLIGNKDKYKDIKISCQLSEIHQIEL